MSVLLYVQSIPEAVAMVIVMAGCRLRGRGFDSRIGIFFFHSLFFVSFFPLSFSFMLAPPFQCSSIFLVIMDQVSVATSMSTANMLCTMCIQLGCTLQ